jgi:YfiH family protein
VGVGRPATSGTLASSSLDDAGFAHAFPERGTGDAELASALGLARGEAVVQVKQVHGAEVIEAADVSGRAGREGREGREEACEGDAVIGRAGEAPIAVGVRVADCVPVLVADETTGDVAAIHAGWRGVVHGVVGKAVAQLRQGRGGAGLVAAIGPCIGPCCFEVGRDVASAIADAVRDASPAAAIIARADDAHDKVYVDLRAAVRAQLNAAGVTRVDDVPGCTKHEPGRFHSFRRDGANSGRMLAAIAARRTS